MVIALLVLALVCIVPLAILVLIISAVVKRNKEEKGHFEESIRNVYIYIILILTLIAIISGVICTFRISLDVILPEKSTYQSSYSNEQVDKNRNIVELFTTLSLVVSSIPVFIYYNKLAKENKLEKSNETNI